MVEPATADLIGSLLLRYHRDPLRFGAQASREANALGHRDLVLRIALGRHVQFSDLAFKAPGAIEQLQRAAAFYIRVSFFREDASYYDVLGLSSNASAEGIRDNFRL